MRTARGHLLEARAQRADLALPAVSEGRLDGQPLLRVLQLPLQLLPLPLALAAYLVVEDLHTAALHAGGCCVLRRACCHAAAPITPPSPGSSVWHSACPDSTGPWDGTGAFHSAMHSRCCQRLLKEERVWLSRFEGLPVRTG